MSRHWLEELLILACWTRSSGHDAQLVEILHWRSAPVVWRCAASGNSTRHDAPCRKPSLFCPPFLLFWPLDIIQRLKMMRNHPYTLGLCSLVKRPDLRRVFRFSFFRGREIKEEGLRVKAIETWREEEDGGEEDIVTLHLQPIPHQPQSIVLSSYLFLYLITFLELSFAFIFHLNLNLV